jgi:hypothetical protein
MRRLLLICAVWTASVLSAAMVVSGCSGAGGDASTSAATKADTPSRAAERFKEITIPRGTTLTFALDDSVGSATSHVDERVRGHLTRAVVIDSEPIVPVGSEVSGAVIEATPSHRVKGRAQVGIRLDKLREGSETYSIATPAIIRTAPGQMKKDTAKVAIPAAAGAVLGGVLGGGKGAVIGGAVGGGAGAGYVMSQHGPEVVLGAGTTLTAKLLEAITVRVRESQSPERVQVAN